MTSAKSVILTAIYKKGIERTRAEAGHLAESALCSRSYVMSIIRKVEKGEITVIS